MQGINFEVIQKVCRWLEDGDSVWFVTIIETWGASPRPKGSIFAYNPVRDRMVGSLSGGCIEEDLIDQLSCFSAASPRRQRYGDSPEEQQRFQLPCGGSLEILIEAVEATPKHIASFNRVEESLIARKRVKRSVDLCSGEVSLAEVPEDCAVLELQENELSLCLGPQTHLLIVGWGEITRYLIPLAKSLDYSVFVCDPRPEVVNRTEISDHDIGFIDGLPDDVVRQHFADAHSAVVALSHDPRVDDLAIMAALETKAFYVGAMGSVNTSTNRKARLASLGMPEHALNRLRAPIGLAVGSKTPPEIAISVAAELIRCQRALDFSNP